MHFTSIIKYFFKNIIHVHITELIINEILYSSLNTRDNKNFSSLNNNMIISFTLVVLPVIYSVGHYSNIDDNRRIL